MDFRLDLGRIFTMARPRDLDELAPWIAATMANYGIDSPLRQCHFLAQIGHESGELRYREEIATGDAYDMRADLGNTPERDGDGRIWKGRGLIQLTGASNYRSYAAFKHRPDILANPSLVASDPELCCDVAGWYWEQHGINLWADYDELEAVTRLVNGGLNGLRNRRRLLDIAKSVLIRDHNEQRSVAALQRALNRLIDADLSVDGVMGRRTRTAVMRFQADHGLLVDGVAGPKTWARINELLIAQSR